MNLKPKCVIISAINILEFSTIICAHIKLNQM